jgi:hypothetical protein
LFLQQKALKIVALQQSLALSGFKPFAAMKSPTWKDDSHERL